MFDREVPAASWGQGEKSRKEKDPTDFGIYEEEREMNT